MTIYEKWVGMGLIPKQLTKENGEILAQHFEKLAEFLINGFETHTDLDDSIFGVIYKILKEINFSHEIDVKELYSFAISLNREEILSTITPRFLGIDTEAEYMAIIADKFIKHKNWVIV